MAEGVYEGKEIRGPVGLRRIADPVALFGLELWGLLLAWWDFICMRRVWQSHFRFRIDYPSPTYQTSHRRDA